MKNRMTIRGTAVATGVLAAAGALTISAVDLAAGGKTSSTTAVASAASLTDTARVQRSSPPAAQKLAVTREKQRQQAARAARQAREARQQQERAARSATRAVTYTGSARQVGADMAAARYGWGGEQFSCLDSLWTSESGWDHRATNPSSGAYGIPQALPGSKMGAYGADWQTNPVTQIEWGLAYIADSYGTPCGAWSAFQAKGWY